MPQKHKKAMDTVLENLTHDTERQNSLPEKDLNFLKVIMDNPVIQSLVKAHSTLEFGKLAPVCNNLSALVDDFVKILGNTNDEMELCQTLGSPHIRSLFKAHDESSGFMQHQYVNTLGSGNGEWQNAIRMIGMSKKMDENLGLTVALVDDDIVVTRILQGGLIHKQGLLHEGDVITEINGNNVKGSPDLLKEYLKKSDGSFVLKTIPSYKSLPQEGGVFVKCNFGYSPLDDSMIPSKEAGLSFERNDILKIVDRRDLRWWQAQHVNGQGEAVGRAGLIPSSDLQERRRVNKSTMSKPAAQMYRLSQYECFSRGDVTLYEEVTFMPPFTRKFIVLISEDPELAHNIKMKLVKKYQHLYKAPITHTSDDDKLSNLNFRVMEKDKMLTGIRKNQYFEHAFQNEHIFGTKYKSVTIVTKSGKICVKDTSPKNLKFLMSPEFMPYVIHVEPISAKPDNITLDDYMHLVNLTLTCESEQIYCEQIHNEVQALAKRSQWVPITWVY